MPTTPSTIEGFAALAAFGQSVLDLVKSCSVAKPKKRKVRATNGTSRPRRKRRTKAEMAAARGDNSPRRHVADGNAED